MAIQSFQLDPSHKHNYNKVTRLGVDATKQWTSPIWVDVVVDGEAYSTDSTDLEGVGVETATTETSTPV